jgi:hypothetical protein
VHGVKSTESAGAKDLATVRRLAAERGIAVTEVVTERAGHCEELVAQAQLAGVDAVGVMGGDGTLRDGVSGMISRPSGDRLGRTPRPCLTSPWQVARGVLCTGVPVHTPRIFLPGLIRHPIFRLSANCSLPETTRGIPGGHPF